MDSSLGPKCYNPGPTSALTIARNRPIDSQRASELAALFGRLEDLRDQCLDHGHSAADFREAALDLLNSGSER